jgi:hypothetical protein
MKATKVILSVSLTLGCLAAAWLAAGERPYANLQRARVRVGTFDSRAVAIAYGNSEVFRRELGKLMEEHKKAKAAGDTAKVKKLEEQGKAGQVRAHEQAFSTGRVDNILEHIKDKLPAIAREAKVDLIVSQWDVAYRGPDADLVDVTDLVVKPFNPGERARGWIKDLKKVAPIPLEDARKIDD